MTHPQYATLPRPPLTALEARLITEDMTLSQRVDQALHEEAWADAEDLIVRKVAVENAFQKSRERTWMRFREDMREVR